MTGTDYTPPPPVHIPSSGAKTAMVILWPAFLAAAALNALIFSLVDPSDLLIHGLPIEFDNLTVYGIGFGICFVFSALSSFMTWSLMRPARSAPIERRSPYSL